MHTHAASLLPLLALLPIASSAHLPVHSWATLPVFFHSSAMNLLTWSADDLAIIARFPVVTIEKWMGCNSTAGCYLPGGQAGGAPAQCPTQENATLINAAALKAIAPNISIISWLDSLRIYSHPALNPDIIDLSYQCCVRNADTPFLEAHREYLLPNTSGLPALEPYIHAHVYDHRSATVRDFWRDACVNLTSTGLIDGCGADASQQDGSYPLGLAPDVASAWTTGHISAVSATTAVVSAAGGLVMGKVGAQLGVSTNGVLQEGCSASNGTVLALRSAAAAAVRDGARYVYECHSDGSADSLAAFLAGAGPDHYWGFGEWVTPYGGVPWKPEFNNALGAPVADAVYTHPEWSRSFASGTTVTFNARTQKGAIKWAA